MLVQPAEADPRLIAARLEAANDPSNPRYSPSGERIGELLLK